MNNEVLTPVAIKDAQAVPEEMVQTPPDLPPAAEPAAEAVAPAPAPAIAIPSLDDSSLYIHRELSQLQFNIRVLEQALDESYPLLERLKFLLIFSSNLDEFFEIRVAGLKKQITFAREQAGADGLQPHQALARISELVHGEVERQYAILNDVLLPELEKHQIRFIRRRHWTTKLKTWVRRYFRDEIAPIITRSAWTRPTPSRCWSTKPELHRRARRCRCLRPRFGSGHHPGTAPVAAGDSCAGRRRWRRGQLRVPVLDDPRPRR